MSRPHSCVVLTRVYPGYRLLRTLARYACTLAFGSGTPGLVSALFTFRHVITACLRLYTLLRRAQGYPFHEGPLTCLAVSSSGSTAITGSEDTTAKLSNLATGKARDACEPRLRS